MNLQKLINTSFSVRMGLFFGQYLPPALSYLVINFIATLLVRMKKLSLVQTVFKNQQIAHDNKLSSKELHQAVKNVFIYAGQGFIDLYHNFKNYDALQQQIFDNDDLKKLINLSKNDTPGVFIVSPHMGSFDLMLAAASARGLKGNVLTIENPNSGYKLQNNIRTMNGLKIMPINSINYQKAIKIMVKGGMVITAVDRPIPGQKHKLEFFNKPCPLPGGYVEMAIKAKVPVRVVSIHKNSMGFYKLKLSEPIPMVPMDNPEQEIIYNAQIILKKIEDQIRAYPLQWQMFYPVYPDG